MDENSIAVSSTITNEDGDEVELFDLQASHEKTEEDRYVDEINFIERLDKIDSVFASLQDRQKKKHSMVLTAWFIRLYEGDLSKAREFLLGKEYLSEEIFDFVEI